MRPTWLGYLDQENIDENRTDVIIRGVRRDSTTLDISFYDYSFKNKTTVDEENPSHYVMFQQSGCSNQNCLSYMIKPSSGDLYMNESLVH